MPSSDLPATGTAAASVLPRRPARAASVLALAALLAACGRGPPPETAGFGCPRVGILRDAAVATTFRPGPGRDLSDVVSETRVADFRGTCEYVPGGVDVDLDLGLVAQRGPALAATRVGHDYFVAVVDGAQNVLARERFRVEFDLGGAPSATAVEQLGQRIPLPRGVDGRNYEILVGFVLSEDQLAWNRRGRADTAAPAAPSAAPAAPQPIPTAPPAPRRR